MFDVPAQVLKIKPSSLLGFFFFVWVASLFQWRAWWYACADDPVVCLPVVRDGLDDCRGLAFD
ncbi:MAG: hypothetical protein AAF711_13315, partial [Planctomycetota bacterium]